MNILFRKSKTAVKLFWDKFLIILFSPICLLIILIKPFYLIRFGFLTSQRIGNLLIVPEIHLAEKAANINTLNQRGFDFFYFDKVISSQLIANKIKQQLCVINPILIRPIHKFFLFFSFYFSFLNKHIIKNHNYVRDSKNLIEKYSPFIKLNESEIKLAKKILNEYGIKIKKIAVFIVRDEAYLNKSLPIGNWKNDNLRNDDVNKYIKSMKFLAKNGYTVFRMGKFMKQKLNTDDVNIIDYAFKDFQSELLDFYLMSNCDICISTDTGLDCISDLSHRRMGTIQFPLSWVRSQRPNLVFVPRKIFNKKTKKFLSLSEMFDYDVISNRNYENLFKNNLEILASDEDEILDLVSELHHRIGGDFFESSNDLINEDKFWSIFFRKLSSHKDYINHNGKYKSKISTSFLRNNDNFLN